MGQVGHVIGGGSVSLVAALPAFALLLVASRRIGRSEISLAGFVGLLAGGQITDHLLCGLMGHGSALDGRMIAGHLFATLMAAILLRRNEVAHWTRARFDAILAFVSGLLGRATQPVIPVESAAATPAFVTASLFSLILGAIVTRRGPPSLVLN
jgi:hypothetical protein